MRTLFFFVLSGFFSIAHSQTTSSFIFKSDILGQERNIRIHLPESVGKDSSKTYPLLLTLDGEYLFYAFMGVSESWTIRDIIPETIIVGIDQNYIQKDNYPARWFDCSYDSKTAEPDEDGLRFKQFITQELIPHLSKHYRIGKFKAIAGHSFTANYINYFLEEPDFKGFIALSPYIPTVLEEKIRQTLVPRTTPAYYFMCTATQDLSGHIPQIQRQDSVLFREINTAYFQYAFRNYEGESHMSLVVRSIPDALLHLYRDYLTIDDPAVWAALQEVNDLSDYLVKRYETIEKVYGFKLTIREDDLLGVSILQEEREDWDDLRHTGLLAVSLYPESLYGYYMCGLAEEKKNNLSSALDYYSKGYAKLGPEVLNKADFYKDIERVEKLMKK